MSTVKIIHSNHGYLPWRNLSQEKNPSQIFLYMIEIQYEQIQQNLTQLRASQYKLQHLGYHITKRRTCRRVRQLQRLMQKLIHPKISPPNKCSTQRTSVRYAVEANPSQNVRSRQVSKPQNTSSQVRKNLVQVCYA